jgi:transcriptional regulator with XRE-family HTH domain
MPKTASLREQFGQRLRALRLQRNSTQEQLAEAAEISVDFLSLVERGVNSPSFEVMERLAKSLKVPVKELFDFER